MKWLNHQVLTGVAVYALTDDLLLTACGMAGAIFPDKVEGNPKRGLLSIGWRSRHRGWSHWLALYLALLFFILQLGDFSLVSSSGETVVSLKAASVQWMAGFFCVGALLHILEDAVCGKVPVFTPNHKMGIKLFSVGSVSEYIFVLVVLLTIYCLKKWAG